MTGFGRRGLTILLVGIVVGGALLGILIPLGAGGPFGRPALQAAPIDPPRLVPDTEGVDADGVPIRVPSEEGRPALVAFLSSDCPTACAPVARIADALERAGDASEDIDVVAISVNPEGDTPVRVNDLLARHDLQGRMRYLVGTRERLEPLWAEWRVDPATPPLILVDERGRQVGAYAPAVPYSAEGLASDIRALT